MVAKIDQEREADNKALIIVDRVHGFGMERDTFQELGCDFFVANCKK